MVFVRIDLHFELDASFDKSIAIEHSVLEMYVVVGSAMTKE